MSSTTYVWGYVDADAVETANKRLRSFYKRHNLELPYWPEYGRNGAAKEVNIMLSELYAITSYEPNPHSPNLRRNGLRVFQRAIGNDEATGLHYDNAGYYQYSR